MANTINKCLSMGILVTIVIFSVSCDTGGGARPWDGQKVYDMRGGTVINPNNIIPNAKTGSVYWFYFGASADTFYEVGLSPYFGFGNGWQNLKDRAPDLAVAKMTCYTEDGTVFGEIDRRTGWTVTYYSLKSQELYVRFEFLTDGYLLFYARRIED